MMNEDRPANRFDFSHLDRGGRNANDEIRGREPRPGDVVSCWFPHDEAPDQPGMKARPCLVLRTQRDAEKKLWIWVAYGTSQQHPAKIGDVDITATDSLKAAGLHRPTRFVLSRARKIPHLYAFFRANNRDSIFLGTLAPPDLLRVQDAARKLEALRRYRRALSAAQETPRPPASKSPVPVLTLPRRNDSPALE